MFEVLHADFHGCASSTGKSGVITPDPEFEAIDAAKASVPYFSIGFQYVITTLGIPRDVAWASASKTSFAPVPAFKDVFAAS